MYQGHGRRRQPPAAPALPAVNGAWRQSQFPQFTRCGRRPPAPWRNLMLDEAAPPAFGANPCLTFCHPVVSFLPPPALPEQRRWVPPLSPRAAKALPALAGRASAWALPLTLSGRYIELARKAGLALNQFY